VSRLRDGRLTLLLILLIAGGLRVAACVVWWNDLKQDPDAYAGLAERLLEGRGFVAPDGRGTAYRPPAYPLLLTSILWAGPAGIAALHIMLGVATVALTRALGRRLDLGNWSNLAALLVAIDPLLLRYTPQVMTETLATFAAATVLWLAAGRRRDDWRRQFLLGAAYGVAVLVRPTFWVFGLFVVLVWLWNAWRDGKHPSSASLLKTRAPHAWQAVFVGLGVSFVVAPWAIRNAALFGRPLLTTTHGGYTLLLANNPTFWHEVVAGPHKVWTGESLGAWQRSLEAAMNEAGLPAHDEMARDRWMRDQALSHIRRQPSMFLRSLVYRLKRLWAVMPVTTEADGGITALQSTTRVFYLIEYIFAILGLVWRVSFLGRRGNCGNWRKSILLIVAFSAVHAIYWTDARMRAPLVPAVALLATLGAAECSQRWREHR
jgi:4-amino-4-deoxy-L-arabinose transferase-like glycosyltransferase